MLGSILQEISGLVSFLPEVAADSRAISARSHPERPGKPSVKGRNTLTSWDIHVNFKLTINKVSKIIVDDNSKVLALTSKTPRPLVMLNLLNL